MKMNDNHKYKLSETGFQHFKELVSKAGGVSITHAEKDFLRQGLAARAAAVGAPTLEDYYRLIITDIHREDELRRLLSQLSVNDTGFFRNQSQFNVLQAYIIPELARRKKEEHRVLRFWCAGCSTGQEPYSVAMSVLDSLPNPARWKVEILATDLSEQALEYARQGWYPKNSLAGVDREHREKYFRHSDGGFQIEARARRLVTFIQHNLVNDPLPIEIFGTCDVVFCRNVIIYFTHSTASFVIEHFFDILNPGGYLFLGHSETLWKLSAKYALVEMGNAFIYRKPLPTSLTGRRFIPDRRLSEEGLPSGVSSDRHVSGSDRRAGENSLV